jgi:hypothetical protein
MFLDRVQDVLPADYAAVPVERVVDQITHFEKTELEFFLVYQDGAMLTYEPKLSAKSPQFGIGGGSYDVVVRAACWAFLRERSGEVPTLREANEWAVKHRFPGPEHPLPRLVEGVAGAPPLDQTAVLRAISEGGKYAHRMAFLLNFAVVVWSPSERQFRFPNIPDHPTANACREYLRHYTLTLSDDPQEDPANAPDVFVRLIEHARRRAWPELEALIERTRFWRSFRPSWR